jgi:hypothetical protein
VPVLFTHHFRTIDEQTGALMGASSDLQVERVREVVTAAGNRFDHVDLPTMPHALHDHDERLYVDTPLAWAEQLPESTTSRTTIDDATN